MVKPDCFAFRQEKRVIFCDVLEDIYCKYQKSCRFYKTAQQYQKDQDKADKINQARKEKKS